MKMIRFIICLLAILIILMVGGCQSIGYQGPVSDHFDGKRFHFPGESAKPQSLAYNAYIFWKAISQNPWPKLLENPKPSPKTNHFPQVRFINHETILIQSGETTILTDPIYSYRSSPLPIIGPARHRLPGMHFNELPKIDIVLISHNHYDHLDIPTLKRLEYQYHPLFIVPLGNKHLLKAHKIQNVVEMDWWQRISHHRTQITMLPAQHSSQRFVFDSNRTLWASYGIDFPGHKYFFAGDTAYNVHFKEIKRRWGKPDLAMLPIGSYEPRKLLRHEHLTPDDAMLAHRDLGAKRSFATHWLTFQLSNVYPDEVLQAFELALKKHHIPRQEFVLLQNGQTMQH
jgi:L-ascorbate metabolism protein UlaG (beta-lactamase superfamily)